MFPIGILITLGGMAILALQSKDRKSYDFITPEDEENIANEERLRLNSDVDEYVDEYVDKPGPSYTSHLVGGKDGQVRDPSVEEDL